MVAVKLGVGMRVHRFVVGRPFRRPRASLAGRAVLRPGGALVVVDNDLRAGQFADLLNASPWAAAQGGGLPTDDWWSQRGAQRVEVMSEWLFQTRVNLEAVLRLEFPADLADGWLAAHPDALGLSYGCVLFTVRRVWHSTPMTIPK